MQVLHREGEPRLLFESAALGVAGALAAQLFMWMLRLPNASSSIASPAINRPESKPDTISPSTSARTASGSSLWSRPSAACSPASSSTASPPKLKAMAPTPWSMHSIARKASSAPALPRIKMLASAITIGSGGSAGREGPIALITADARLLVRSPHPPHEDQRRLLLLAGMAAGLSAIFRSPMGTGVFAIEVLYGNMEFEVGALLYTMCSSAVAYAVNGLFVGFRPLFHIPAIRHSRLDDYAFVCGCSALPPA